MCPGVWKWGSLEGGQVEGCDVVLPQNDRAAWGGGASGIKRMTAVGECEGSVSGLGKQRIVGWRKEVLCQGSGEWWYQWKEGCPRKNPLEEANHGVCLRHVPCEVMGWDGHTNVFRT